MQEDENRYLTVVCQRHKFDEFQHQNFDKMKKTTFVEQSYDLTA